MPELAPVCRRDNLGFSTDGVLGIDDFGCYA